MKYVQYECIKSELKEEYDRRLENLTRKFDLKCLQDPSLMLLGSFKDTATTKSLH